MFIQEEGRLEGYHEKGRERELKSTLSCCLSEQQQFTYKIHHHQITPPTTIHEYGSILIICGSVEWIGLTLRSCPDDGEGKRIYQYVIDIQMRGLSKGQGRDDDDKDCAAKYL